MTITSVVRIHPLLLAFLCSAFPAVAADVNLAGGTSIKASSTFGNSKAAVVADGVVSDESLWLASAGDAAPWVELTFPKPVKIEAIDVFSGYRNEGALDAFDLTFEVEGQLVNPAAEKVRDNREMTRQVGVDVQNVLAETPISLAYLKFDAVTKTTPSPGEQL